MNTYEFNKFGVVVIDDSEGVYKDQPIVEKDLTSTSETRMGTACTLVKTLYGSLKPCFITIDTFTGSPDTSSVRNHYKSLIDLPEYSMLYNWSTTDQTSFVYDLRYGATAGIELVRSAISALNTPVYLKNTFVDIANTWAYGFNRSIPWSPGPYVRNYYDTDSYYWTEPAPTISITISQNSTPVIC